MNPHNGIKVCVDFSFKGESYHLCASIDLDEVMQENREVLNYYLLLAKANAIDTYSYMYETMEASELEFHQPSGLASDCMDGGIFDLDKFKQQWVLEKHLQCIKEIAKEHLDITDIESHPQLKQALLAAYQAGENRE